MFRRVPILRIEINGSGSRVRYYCWPAAAAIILLLTAQSCGPGADRSAWGTRVAINTVRDAISAFQKHQGRLPRTLGELCTEAAACDQLPPGGVRDPWGSEIAYSLTGEEYELRSPGADRTLNTPDDISFVPSWERTLVIRSAGCYRVQVPEWDGLAGERVVLDTLPRATGLYRLLPAVAGREGFWFPHGDSISLIWLRTPDVTRIVLNPGDTGMQGYWITSGERSRSGPREVRAARARCE